MKKIVSVTIETTLDENHEKLREYYDKKVEEMGSEQAVLMEVAKLMIEGMQEVIKDELNNEHGLNTTITRIDYLCQQDNDNA